MITTTMSVVDFDKATLDFQFLLDCFIEVLQELGQTKLATHLRGEHSGAITECEHPERAVQALSVVFQLLNMAEENSAAQYRRKLESTEGVESLSGL